MELLKLKRPNSGRNKQTTFEKTTANEQTQIGRKLAL